MATAQEQRDRSLHRHGSPDPSKWEEGPNKTDRPQPLVENSTFASRAAARKPATKQVKSAEDKAVKGSSSK